MVNASRWWNMQMHAMQCKILQPLGSFHHPFKFPCISANFQDFGIFLHLVSSFCGVDGTNLVISTQRGGPPQFYRTTGPLSTRFFLWQMHQDDAACIACSANQCNAKFCNLSDLFNILSKAMAYLKTFPRCLQICSTWSGVFAVLVAKALLFSHKGLPLSIL